MEGLRIRTKIPRAWKENNVSIHQSSPFEVVVPQIHSVLVQ